MKSPEKSANFIYDYPAPPTTVSGLVTRGARLYGDKCAFTYMRDDRRINVTYGEFIVQVEAVSRWLGEMKHERFALIGANSYEWILCYFSVMAAGRVMVPLDRQLSETDLDELTKRYGCTIVVDLRKTESDGSENRIIAGEVLAAASGEGKPLVENNPDDISCIVSTSGTTERIKGVLLTHRNICASIGGCVKSVNPNGTILALLPLHHIYSSVISVLAIFACGGCIAIGEQITMLMEYTQRFRPNYICVVPAILEAVRRNVSSRSGFGFALRTCKILKMVGIDMRRVFFRKLYRMLGGRLEYFVSGGAPLSAECERFFYDVGITVLNGYGMTESAGGICINRVGLRQQGSVGLPTPGTEMRVDDNGEVLIKGDMVSVSYDGGVPTDCENGWLHTGDLGSVDENGFYCITGRIKNLIILSNGENISPEEMEARLSAIKGVSEVLVYAEDNLLCAEFVPDGEKLCAMNIEDAHAYFSAEVDTINRTLPTYKAIASVRVRGCELEKSASRKIIRRSRSFAYAPPQNSLEAAICTAFSQALGGIDVSRNDSIFKLGGDSLAVIEAAVELYECGIEPQDIYRFPTPAALAEDCAKRDEHRSFVKKTEINGLIMEGDGKEKREETNILLTGATGYLGAHLLYRLVNDGKKVRCLVRDKEKLDYVLGRYFGKNRISFDKVYEGDISQDKLGLSDDEYRELLKWTSSVVHTAANVRHADSYEAMARVNVHGVENVLLFCREADASLQHCSTMSLSGYNPARPLDECSLDIGQSVELNPYLLTKYRAEELVLLAAANGQRANIYRIGNLSWRRDGAFQINYEDNGLLARQCALRALRVFPSDMLDFRQDYTPVDECADAFVRLMNLNGTGYIRHLYNPDSISVGKMVGFCPGVRAVGNDAFDAACDRLRHNRSVPILRMYVDMYRRGFRESAVCEKTLSALAETGFSWRRVSPARIIFLGSKYLIK